MTGETDDITETDLLAYVDGEASEGQCRRIEAHLAAHPAAAERVEAYRRQNGRLGALYGPVAREPLPERLRPHAIARRRPAEAPRWRSLAAGLVLLALGGTGGWYGRDLAAGGAASASEPLVARAIEAHDLYASEVVHPVEMRADESGGLQAWLSRRLDRALTVPDLRSEGLTLIGGRLLPSGGGPAAQLMYEDETGRRLTLFVVPTAPSGESALRFSRESGLQAVWWSDETIGCAIVGDLPKEKLRSIATAAYGQLI